MNRADADEVRRGARHLAVAMNDHRRHFTRNGTPEPRWWGPVITVAEAVAVALGAPPDTRAPTPPPPQSQTLSYAEAAAIAGISRRTLSRRVAAGLLPLVERRIPRAALQHHLHGTRR